ncbi:pyridoxamine 5'-phosphate oxidase family protein [Lacticaseibacillus zhaodongensis]|uniref:pyridoxamine 5'-phosphate oxidase family protein n=1 Tax=Lacticaseibacillus zhaodongensis TaxID=2668065 RepID=UPI0012D2E4E4|nr:pyridoxamine 5'-phosphate oxidase family protein [Lacticaseibacillus zhaodongensis]
MQKVRRRDREIGLDEIKKAVADCHVVHLGLNDSPFPYVVPTNYGYEWQGDQLLLYIHGARQGKKRDLIAADPHVCIEIDGGMTLLSAGDEAPDYSAYYRSVIGFGTAELVADADVKRHALDLLMQHETGRHLDSFNAIPDNKIFGVGVIKVTITELTGKAHPAPKTE